MNFTNKKGEHKSSILRDTAMHHWYIIQCYDGLLDFILISGLLNQ